jgi:hypothetical protein
MLFRKARREGLDVPVTSLLDADIDFTFQDAPASPEDRVRVSPEERDVLHLVTGARIRTSPHPAALA